MKTLRQTIRRLILQEVVSSPMEKLAIMITSTPEGMKHAVSLADDMEIIWPSDDFPYLKDEDGIAASRWCTTTFWCSEEFMKMVDKHRAVNEEASWLDIKEEDEENGNVLISFSVRYT